MHTSHRALQLHGSWCAGRHALLTRRPWRQGRQCQCHIASSAFGSQQQGDRHATAAETGRVVALLRECCRVGAGHPASEVVVQGTGRHQGTDVSWQLRWRCSDGAFQEQVRGRDISYRWGFDGREHCWEEDDSGCTRPLLLDDFEAVLLAGWIRTGTWATEAGARLLEVALDGHTATEAAGTPGAAHASISPACANSSAVVIDPQLPEAAQPAPSGGEDAGEGSAASSVAEAGQRGMTLSVRLKGGKVVARVQVCGSSWHPVSMTNQVCSDIETWQFEEWRDWLDGPQFPRTTLHQSGCGGLHKYEVQTLQARGTGDGARAAAELLLASTFRMPQLHVLPPCTRFLPGVPAATPAWYCPSGHILVRPAINGHQAGYMLLDTGASGFVIDPLAAEGLGLHAFGELHVTGMAGKVQSNFRRGESFELGPLAMERPLFMEMSCSGLVRGAPGPVVGIIGYEVFRRAIVDIPPRPRPAPVQPPTMAADAGVDSAAAAFAASLASCSGGRAKGAAAEAVLYCIYLHNPELCGALGDAPVSTSHLDSINDSSWRSENGTAVAEAAAAVFHQVEGAEVQAVASSPSIPSSSSGSLGGKEGGTHSQVDWDHEPSPRQVTHTSGVPAGSLEALPWSPVKLIANLPHVEVWYTPGMAPGLQPRTSLFMLDSGAGGVDMMFNARAAEDFDLNSGPQAGHRFIKGVGGDEGGRVRVASGELRWLELGGVRFEGVKALLARSGSAGAGIDLSMYTAGIVCGDLLSRCRVVLDYARSRIAIVPEDGPEPDSRQSPQLQQP